jgi:hypothetical protein
MKKLQGGILNIVPMFGLMCCLAFQSDAATSIDSVGTRISRGTALGKLGLADSLFRRKQYTQSLELYDEIFQHKYYTPSMLLKLAFIQEGLGHLGQSIYYLNLYFLATHDPLALVKIEEVAARNKLEGYSDSDAARLWTVMKENHFRLLGSLLSICVFLFALVYYQKVKLKRKPIATELVLLLFLVLLFIQSYLLQTKAQGIIASASTYLMSGPSAGSSVIAIVGEGHRLEILGRKDVWVKVRWLDSEVFVKEDALLRVQL